MQHATFGCPVSNINRNVLEHSPLHCNHGNVIAWRSPSCCLLLPGCCDSKGRTGLSPCLGRQGSVKLQKDCGSHHSLIWLSYVDNMWNYYAKDASACVVWQRNTVMYILVRKSSVIYRAINCMATSTKLHRTVSDSSKSHCVNINRYYITCQGKSYLNHLPSHTLGMSWSSATNWMP